MKRNKPLSKYEIEQRECNSNYFKDGRPKRGSMMCRNQSYISEIKSINGYYDINWTCAGNRCPLYATGCDDKGRNWE